MRLPLPILFRQCAANWRFMLKCHRLDYANIDGSRSGKTKKAFDKHWAAAASHLPNIKLRARQKKGMSDCRKITRPMEHCVNLFYSGIAFYRSAAITCTTLIATIKSRVSCRHHFKSNVLSQPATANEWKRRKRRRSREKTVDIENVDAYSCVDFVTSANIHTQDLLVLINKCRRR